MYLNYLVDYILDNTVVCNNNIFNITNSNYKYNKMEYNIKGT